MPLHYLGIIFILVAFWTADAFAYVGPSLGVGTIGVVLGIFASILLALLAVVYYPIKRVIRSFRKKRDHAHEEENS